MTTAAQQVKAHDPKRYAELVDLADGDLEQVEEWCEDTLQDWKAQEKLEQELYGPFDEPELYDFHFHNR